MVSWFGAHTFTSFPLPQPEDTESLSRVPRSWRTWTSCSNSISGCYTVFVHTGKRAFVGQLVDGILKAGPDAARNMIGPLVGALPDWCRLHLSVSEVDQSLQWDWRRAPCRGHGFDSGTQSQDTAQHGGFSQ
jgi:hypothetical protein